MIASLIASECFVQIHWHEPVTEIWLQTLFPCAAYMRNGNEYQLLGFQALVRGSDASDTRSCRNQLSSFFVVARERLWLAGCFRSDATQSGSKSSTWMHCVHTSTASDWWRLLLEDGQRQGSRHITSGRYRLPGSLDAGCTRANPAAWLGSHLEPNLLWAVETS